MLHRITRSGTRTRRRRAAARDLSLDTDFPAGAQRLHRLDAGDARVTSAPARARFDVDAGTTYYIQLGIGRRRARDVPAARGRSTRRRSTTTSSTRTTSTGGRRSTEPRSPRASRRASRPTVTGHAGVRSVWYRWVPIGTGAATVRVEAEQDDPHAPLVQLYEATAQDPTFADLDLGRDARAGRQRSGRCRAQVHRRRERLLRAGARRLRTPGRTRASTSRCRCSSTTTSSSTPRASPARTGRSHGTNVGATFPEASEPDPSGDIDNTVWYSWTAPANGPGDVRRRRRVLRRRGRLHGRRARQPRRGRRQLGLGQPLAAVHRAGRRDLLHPARDVLRRARRRSRSTWSLAARPANDDWADAAAIAGESGSTDGTNVGATTEAGEPLSLSHRRRDDARHGLVEVGRSLRRPLPVRHDRHRGRHGARRLHGLGRERADRGHLQRRRHSGPWQSRVLFTAVAGTTYYFQVGSYGEGDMGPFTARMEPPARQQRLRRRDRVRRRHGPARRVERRRNRCSPSSPTRRAATSRAPSGTRGRRPRAAAPRSRSTPRSAGRSRSTRGARSTRSRGWQATTTEPRSRRRSPPSRGRRTTSRSGATSTRPGRSRSTGASSRSCPSTTS